MAATDKKESLNPGNDTTIKPTINPRIIADTLAKPEKEIRDVIEHIYKYHIRIRPDNDDNENYLPEPKFIKDEKNGKSFINIRWKKFYEYTEWKKYTWFWYIYNEKNEEFILARIVKWKISTPYAIINKNKERTIIETHHYRNLFSTNVQEEMVRNLSQMDDFDFQSYEIAGTGRDDTSEYLIIKFTNLRTKEKDKMICRKYLPGITWPAYKELGNWKREIWFYEKGLNKKIIVDNIDYIYLPSNTVLF